MSTLFIIGAFFALLTIFTRPDFNLPMYAFFAYTWNTNRVIARKEVKEDEEEAGPDTATEVSASDGGT